MTDPVNTGRDEFNDILERCIEAVGSGRATVEQCAARYPDYPELADLLRLTVAFRKLPRPSMPAAFTTKTQQRLQRQFRERMRPARTPTRWTVFGRALAAVLVIAVILVAGGYGVVRASDNTVPGDPLYRVKLWNEQAELYFAGARHPQVMYNIAQARITEIKSMSNRGQPIDSSFLNAAATTVTLARNEQADGALQDNLSSGLLSAVAYGQSRGTILPNVADLLLARLALTFGLPQPVTPTPTTVVQSQTTTPTPTSTTAPTSTYTPTPQPTPTFSATPTFSVTPTFSATPPTFPTRAQATRAPTKRVTAAPSATPTTELPAPPTATTAAAPNLAVTVVPTAVLGPGPARIMTGIPTEPSTTATVGPTGTQATASATASPDVTSAATPTGTLTEEVNGTPTETFTTTPSTTPSETPTATLTLTISSTATLTPTRTLTPSRTRRPTRAPTKTPTPTVPSPTPPPTATPTNAPPAPGLPSSDFKQAWQQITFHDCPPQGDGGDSLLNQTKNRVDEGNYQQTAFDALANLSWPKDGLGKSRDQWSQAVKDEVGRSEGLPLIVEGYLIKVQENDPEAQNCHSNDFKTWQIWVLGSSGSNNDLSKALRAGIGPRIRANHGGWTLEKLNVLVGTKIRVSGWLMFNQEHPEDIGKTRLSPWEIHPVMQIAVSIGNQWVNLDDYHP